MAHAAHDPHTATVIAGVPSIHKGVFHRIRFMAHDPACLVELPDGRAVLILRDVELARAKSEARADEVYAYQDFTPDGGLSADREVAAAQSLAECLRRHQIKTAYVDRALPLLFADELQHHDVRVVCDRTLSARRRRSKDAAEVDAMRRGQRVTEDAIRMACELIADATADDSGVLRDPTDAAQPLTSERVKSAITVFLAERGFVNEACIVAGGAQGADCHHSGAGPLRTGEPIIVDVFPLDTSSSYYGDCTRVVVHGQPTDDVRRMHAIVVAAKRAAIETVRAGASADAVHAAAVAVITGAGYQLGFPPEPAPPGFCSMPHGTGHGLGLDLKEPPLLDVGGPELVVGDAITVEPGLYAPGVGGIRIEDLVIVTEGGCENLNRLPEGMSWS